MATCIISDSFDIVVEGVDLNVAKNFTTTRGFILEGITATNIAAGAGTLTVTRTTTTNGAAAAGVIMTAVTAAPPTAGAGVVQAQSVLGPTAPVTVLAANCIVPDPQNGQGTAGDPAVSTAITVAASAVTITKAILHCVASPSQVITIA